MNPFHLSLLAAVVLLTPGIASAQKPSTVESEMVLLRGTFTMVNGQADGQEMPAAMASSMKRVSEGNVTTVTTAGVLYLKATYTINPAASPKTVDYEMTGGFTTGQKQLGLYRINADTVTFCFGSPGKPRPTEFVSRPGGGVTCSVWKRDEP